jgi:asparagine synthase (glutamine-hydrolysing)
MSGIVGIVNLAGNPVDSAIVKRMTRTLVHRGPDGAGVWSDGPVGLAQLMFHTTPESYHDRQPLTDEAGQICLILDGRVDNRTELKAALEAKGVRVRDETDSELVLHSYMVWGKSSVDHIFGDFAFVIWDKRTQSLFMARDPIGIRPLLYWLAADLLIIASEPAPIFEHPAIEREVNWAVLGDRLTNNRREHEETFDAGVLRLPAGHIAVVEEGVFSKQRYWPGEQQEIRYRRPEEYAEHFLDLLEEALRCRLRSSIPVGILLSGGLDSSSLTCVAQDILRKNLDGVAPFETFSRVYPGLDCDESTYIDAVTGELDVPSHRITFSENSDGSPRLERAAEFPDIPFSPGVMGDILLTAQNVKEKGIKVLINGIGGDELFSALPWWNLADTLRTGDLLRFSQRLQYVHELEGGPLGRLLLGHAVLPLLPVSSQEAIWRVYRTVLKKHYKKVVPWIDPQFVTRWHLQERLDRHWPLNSLQKDIAKKHLANLFTASYNMVFALQLRNRVLARLGLEERFPYLDRRLLDYCLAIPEQYRTDDERTKPLLRKALFRLLPDRIRRRNDKVNFDELMHLQVNSWQAATVDAAFADLQLATAGVLLPERAQALLLDYRRGNLRAAAPINSILIHEMRYRNAVSRGEFDYEQFHRQSKTIQ